jgi:hypothetical protein
MLKNQNWSSLYLRFNPTFRWYLPTLIETVFVGRELGFCACVAELSIGLMY